MCRPIVNLTTTKKDDTKDLQPCIDRLAKLLEDFSGGKINCKVQQDFSITSFRGTPLTTKELDLRKLKTERPAEAVLKLETDQAAALAVKGKEKATAQALKSSKKLARMTEKNARHLEKEATTKIKVFSIFYCSVQHKVYIYLCMLVYKRK